MIERRGIKYLGQYKPIGPYALSDDMMILPSEGGMFPTVRGATIHMNVSYIETHQKLDDVVFMDAYRRWLTFDAFVLNGQWPIFYFDQGEIGDIVTIPASVPLSASSPDYKQIDYQNISRQMFNSLDKNEVLPIISYSDLYTKYLQLPNTTRDMIEWYVSSLSLPATRQGAFLNTNYWQLVHATILLEQLIGLPEHCSHSLENVTRCKCGRKSQPHHALSRNDWINKFLSDTTKDANVAEQYAALVINGKKVRDKMGHSPTFDRSVTPEFALEVVQIYGTDRATSEYKNDSVALQSLIISLNKVARYLLLDKAFGTKYFPILPSLKSVRVAGASL